MCLVWRNGSDGYMFLKITFPECRKGTCAYAKTLTSFPEVSCFHSNAILNFWKFWKHLRCSKSSCKQTCKIFYVLHFWSKFSNIPQMFNKTTFLEVDQSDFSIPFNLHMASIDVFHYALWCHKRPHDSLSRKELKNKSQNDCFGCQATDTNTPQFQRKHHLGPPMNCQPNPWREGS